MHRPTSRAAMAGALVLALVGSMGAVQAPDADDSPDLTAQPLTPTGRVEAHKAPTSHLAQTDPDLLARNDASRVNVVIKLDYDSAATYAGGIAGFAPTSPSATGRQLTGASSAERSYSGYVDSVEARFIADLTDAVPSAQVGRPLRTVYGGLAATIPAEAVEAVLGVDGAVAVQYDSLEQPLTDSSPEFVNAGGAYDLLDTMPNAGEGIILGNLDTGIWPEHPSFADQGNLDAPPGPSRECNYGDNPTTPEPDVFVCQNKLIGGAHFTDAYDAIEGDDPFAGTARDHNGHGTHTSSTSAGNVVASATVSGADHGPVNGMAPGAWVMEYKVCGPQGCFSSDSAAAVGQAIIDGVDVINFSISGGTDPFTDPVELAFLDAYAAGVFVSASAGNNGPGAGTSNHLGLWTTTVGASTQTRTFGSTLTLEADNGDTLTADGVSITAGAGPAPVVLAATFPGYEDPLCLDPAPAGIFAGLIVACQRGTNARVAKGVNVLQGGAVGHVLYNVDPAANDTVSDNHWLPSIHLPLEAGFHAFMESHAGVVGSFPDGKKRDAEGDVMAGFSSRGPAGLAIKPDLTAPGVEILAGTTPVEGNPEDGGGPAGNLFMSIAGTSMASPHVAGAALLTRAVHPNWTPGQIKSALMTTAITDVVKEDRTTPADAFDMGAGRIDIGTAQLAPVTFDETPERFLSLGGDRASAVHLNLPSINALVPGRLETTREVTNVSGRTERFDLSAVAPEGSTITVRPGRLVVPRGKSRTFTVVIESDAPTGAQQFGQINLDSTSGSLDLHLPVAFLRSQGEVNLTQACSPGVISKGEVTECTVEATNNSFVEQTVDLDTTVDKGLKIVAADGAEVRNSHHAQLPGVTLDPAVPGAPSVDPGSSPAGYLPLDQFTDPIAVGDEQVINFTSPSFDYNGESWTSFGVDSNGYVIIGGGTAEDNECCNLPDGADPARPNNVLAPFWTDLDGTDAPGIFVAVLNDGANSWIVIEWRLNVVGTSDQRAFQSWIGLNTDTDPGQNIAFTYRESQTDPGRPFLVGAENVAGVGDVADELPTGEDLRVTSTGPTPGGQAGYSVSVRGQNTGTHAAATEMGATGIAGVTIATTDIRVSRPFSPEQGGRRLVGVEQHRCARARHGRLRSTSHPGPHRRLRRHQRRLRRQLPQSCAA